MGELSPEGLPAKALDILEQQLTAGAPERPALICWYLRRFLKSQTGAMHETYEAFLNSTAWP